MSLQSIGIIFNSRSGAGRGAVLATQVKQELEAAGYRIFSKESRASYHKTELLAFLRSVELLVVIGGDGTVAQLLPGVAETERPIYIIPAGNESLISRRFGMQSTVADLIDRLHRKIFTRHYFGRANGHSFFTMVSLGLDSEVVDRIARVRRGPIGHHGYLFPMIASWIGHSPPVLTVQADGAAFVTNEPGYLIIANSPEYALRMNLVPEADTVVADLTARFFPGMSRAGYAKIFGQALFGNDIDLSGTRIVRAREFKISVGHGAYPIQADGEAVGTTPATVSISGSDYISVLSKVDIAEVPEYVVAELEPT